jgi:hypothetical protein
MPTWRTAPRRASPPAQSNGHLGALGHLGDPAQPQVHRIPGVEPAGPKEGRAAQRPLDLGVVR